MANKRDERSNDEKARVVSLESSAATLELPDGSRGFIKYEDASSVPLKVGDHINVEVIGSNGKCVEC